jgi:adenylate cyclase
MDSGAGAHPEGTIPPTTAQAENPQASFLQARRFPLLVKLALVITLAICVTTAVIGYVVLSQQARLFLEELTARGQALVQHLAENADTPLLEQDDLTLNVLVEKAKNNKDVAYAAVVDPRGVIVAHNDLTQIGKALRSPGGDGKDKLLEFTAPIRYQKKGLGQAHLGVSEEGMRRNIQKARLFIFALMIGIIALGIGTSLFISNAFSRPVRLLVEGTKVLGLGNFQHRLPPLSVGGGQDELTDLGRAFNEMAEDLRKKELLEDSFGRYVSPEIAEMIFHSAAGPWLEPRRHEVTVLFVDIRGYTPYAERTPPAIVIELLNQFFGLATEAIIRNGGFISKFLGDAIMAIFGAPAPQPDQAYRAALAALEIQAEVEEFNRKRSAEGKDPIVVGIGINRGDVVAGSVGSTARMEYTVVGDAVNVASRLTAAAKGGEILIGLTALEPAADRLRAQPLPRLQVKGKAEPLEVFLLLGRKDAATAEGAHAA